MLVPVLLFILGLILLIKGGDWFVDGATGIAHKFHVPELLIGATVVSIGTTIPEVMVSATSALTGHGEIAYGNAIGSIICNTALVAAITLAVRPGVVERKSIQMPLIFFYVAAGFYMGTAYLSGFFSRVTGGILLVMFCIYIFLCIKQAKATPVVAAATSENISGIEDGAESQDATEEEKPFWKNILLLILGAALIAVGANLLVNNGTLIAQALGVPESVIALTFVALGTSLPELVTAITALAKGHSDLSLGNVIGANLFNLVLVSGVSTVLSPFPIPVEKTLAGVNASLLIDMPVMLGVMLIMTLPALIKEKLYRAQGIILMCIYAAFCVFQLFI